MAIFLSVIILGLLLYSLIMALFMSGLIRLREDNSNDKIHFISVVIAARNEEHTLPRLLDALHRQDYPEGQWECIVVDDRSTDGTARVVEKYRQNWPDLQLVQVESLAPGISGKKNALDKGIAVSKGEVIALTDADCEPGPRWLITLNSCFTPSTGAVYGLTHTDHPGQTLFQRLQTFDFFSYFALGAAGTGVNWQLAAAGGNFAYRRQAYDEVGGYQSLAHIPAGDDDQFMQLLASKTNWKIAFCSDPSTWVYSDPAPDWDAFKAQRSRWATKVPHWSLPIRIMAWGYFCLNVFLLICIPASLISLSYLWLLPVLYKIGLDFLFYGLASLRLGKPHLMKIQPLWSLLSLVWIPYIALVGRRYKVEWKGRRY